MEESKRKMVMVIVIVVCLALAAVVAYRNYTKDSTTIKGIKRGTIFLMKCNNPDCGHELEIDKKDYIEWSKEQMDAGATRTPGMPCPKCGEESVFRAVKCPKCGTVFFYGRGGAEAEAPDICPECGYSETFEKMKERRKKREEQREKAIKGN